MREALAALEAERARLDARSAAETERLQALAFKLGAQQWEFEAARDAFGDTMRKFAPGGGAGHFLARAIARRSEQVCSPLPPETRLLASCLAFSNVCGLNISLRPLTLPSELAHVKREGQGHGRLVVKCRMVSEGGLRGVQEARTRCAEHSGAAEAGQRAAAALAASLALSGLDAEPQIVDARAQLFASPAKQLLA